MATSGGGTNLVCALCAPRNTETWHEREAWCGGVGVAGCGLRRYRALRGIKAAESSHRSLHELIDSISLLQVPISYFPPMMMLLLLLKKDDEAPMCNRTLIAMHVPILFLSSLGQLFELLHHRIPANGHVSIARHDGHGYEHG